jgi:alginate O-acetyltransferase complex protein AlgJ
LLCAAVFTAIMVMGSYQIWGAATNPDGLDMPRDWKSFREGISTQALEKQLDQKMPMRQTLIALANSTRYKLFGGGAEQVRVGKNDWLFLTDELRFEGDDGKTRNAANLKARLDLIASIAKRLESQSVHLVLALVPDKARLYPDQLQAGVYPLYNQSRYADILQGLEARKVRTVNLWAPFAQAAGAGKDGELYYRTDTHWNQKGARIAAQEIGAVVNQVVGAMKLDIERTEFASKPSSAQQERPGDLIRLMGLEHVPDAFRPKPDREALEVTTPKSVQQAAQGLFGDSAVPVALTGTSYSMRGNFHGYLQESLAAKVLNTAKDGGGFLQAMTAYLKDDSFKAAKPKVLIWEVPERMLRSPLEGEAIWLEKNAF